MTENNGKVSQSDFYRELKEVRQDISTILVKLTEYHGEVSRATVERGDLKKALDGLSRWKDETDERIDKLESEDADKEREAKIMIAAFGTFGVVIGSLIAALAEYLIAGL